MLVYQRVNDVGWLAHHFHRKFAIHLVLFPSNKSMLLNTLRFDNAASEAKR